MVFGASEVSTSGMELTSPGDAHALRLQLLHRRAHRLGSGFATPVLVVSLFEGKLLGLPARVEHLVGRSECLLLYLSVAVILLGS